MSVDTSVISKRSNKHLIDERVADAIRDFANAKYPEHSESILRSVLLIDSIPARIKNYVLRNIIAYAKRGGYFFESPSTIAAKLQISINDMYVFKNRYPDITYVKMDDTKVWVLDSEFVNTRDIFEPCKKSEPSCKKSEKSCKKSDQSCVLQESPTPPNKEEGLNRRENENGSEGGSGTGTEKKEEVEQLCLAYDNTPEEEEMEIPKEEMEKLEKELAGKSIVNVSIEKTLSRKKTTRSVSQDPLGVTGLCQVFKKEVIEKLPDAASFFRDRDFSKEAAASAKILDQLLAVGAKDEKHVMEWIRWYIQDRLAKIPVSKYGPWTFEMEKMRLTWGDYVKVMSPVNQSISAAAAVQKTGVAVRVRGFLGTNPLSLGSSSVTSSLMTYGIIPSAIHMRDVLKIPKQDIEIKIKTCLADMVKQGMFDRLASVFKSSREYSASGDGIPYADWENHFEAEFHRLAQKTGEKGKFKNEVKQMMLEVNAVER